MTVTATVTVVAEFVAAAGQGDRLRTTLEGLIEPSLEEAGCLAFRPYADPNRAGHMVVVEEWESSAALAEHSESAHVAYAAKVLGEVLAEPMVVRRLTDA